MNPSVLVDHLLNRQEVYTYIARSLCSFDYARTNNYPFPANRPLSALQGDSLNSLTPKCVKNDGFVHFSFLQLFDFLSFIT